MEKTQRSLPRMLWIFSLFLTLLPFSASAGEIKSFLGHTGILTRGTNSEPSTGAAVESGAVVSASRVSTSNFMPIPFQLADGLIYIQASLDGSAPLWVMLDTGSSVTVFDESVPRMLGMQLVGEGNAYGPGQGSSEKLSFTKHATLSFAGVELGDQTIGTLPLQWFSREIGRSTDGFLGSNVFRNYVVEIDYSSQVLRLYDPAGYSYSGPGERLPLQFVWNGIPTVRAEIVRSDGTVIQGTFLVDSGATTEMWLTKGFNDAHPELLSADEAAEVPGVVAVGGELNARLGHLFAIRLGEFVVPMPQTQFLENTSGTFAAPGLAGTIGAQMLSRFKVIFDYAHGEMILESHD
jgi:Aspartyl protease